MGLITMGEMLDAIEACIATAQQVVEALAERYRIHGTTRNSELAKSQWLERQIRTLLSKLRSVQADMLAGLHHTEMGFSDPSDIQEMLEDIQAQIYQLGCICVANGRDRTR